MSEGQPERSIWSEGGTSEILIDPSDKVHVGTVPGGSAQVTIARANGSKEEWLIQPRPGRKFNAYNIIGGRMIFDFVPAHP